MSITFSDSEHHLLELFKTGETFNFNNKNYMVIESGKPTCSKGEPKTDIYVSAKNNKNNSIKEFKISYKQKNANFLENKINAERAKQLFGNNWKRIISVSTETIKDEFLKRKLIFKNKFGKTNKGSITLGWKFELLNIISGDLSGKMELTRNQVVDVYAGTNLENDKRDALVNGKVISNSGIANYILFENETINNIQDAVNSIITIDEYVDNNPNVYFACKALNYRSLEDKYDGNRPLSVFVNWFIINNKLNHEICFDNPLCIGGKDSFVNLRNALNSLELSTTNDIDESIIVDNSIIYE